jgi:hypothetical protein
VSPTLPVVVDDDDDRRGRFDDAAGLENNRHHRARERVRENSRRRNRRPPATAARLRRHTRGDETSGDTEVHGRRWRGRGNKVYIGPRDEVRGKEGTEARQIHTDQIGDRVRDHRGRAESKCGLNGW